MTDEARARLEALGLNTAGFARLVDVTLPNVYRWGKVTRQPMWVESWLTGWETVQRAGLPLPWDDQPRGFLKAA